MWWSRSSTGLPSSMSRGSLSWGRTRGDGEYGENITPNLRTVRRLPLRIPVMSETKLTAPERLVLRSEAYVDKADFEAYNRRQAAEEENLRQPA